MPNTNHIESESVFAARNEHDVDDDAISDAGSDISIASNQSIEYDFNHSYQDLS